MMTKEQKIRNGKIFFVIAMAILLLPIILWAAAVTSDPWDGTGWNTSAPNDEALYGQAYLELQDLRKGVEIRINKEHTTLASSSAGGVHKNGSAVCYEGTTEEPNRPDTTTALADNAYDRGRLWLDDNFDPPVLKRWDGSAWEVVGTIAAGSAPKAYMHNTTHEDTERGRESQIRVYGEQSGGERSTLGYLEFSHDGTSDDQKGRLIIALNDGDDANTPSIIPIVWTSNGIDVADSNAVFDEDTMASDDASRLATQQSIKAYADERCPVGSIMIWSTDTAPTGWVLCDGTAYSRTVTYDALFAVISTTYGVGDGSTTFNVPDLRGRVPVGLDDGDVNLAAADALNESGGAETVTLTKEQSGVPSHTHVLNINTSGGGGDNRASNYFGTGEVGQNTESFAGADAAEAHTNVQPYLTITYIIKYR